MSLIATSMKGKQKSEMVEKWFSQKELVVFPARYAVMPSATTLALPGKTASHNEPPVPGYQYALRILREGYIYLYYESPPDGRNPEWEIYTCDVNASLSLIDYRTLYEKPPKSITPPRESIHIEKPAQQGRVWLTFSEHAWSDDTFKAMEDNEELRARRMQFIEPKAWLLGKTVNHGAEATQKNIEQILEYSGSNEDYALIADPPPETIRKTEPISETRIKEEYNAETKGQTTQVVNDIRGGGYEPELLAKHYTRYFSRLRHNESEELNKKLQPHDDASQNKPLLLALWDRVGVFHELNGFHNDPAAQLRRYEEELSVEIDAMRFLDSAKTKINGMVSSSFDRKVDEVEEEYRLNKRITMPEEVFKSNKSSFPPGTSTRLLRRHEYISYSANMDLVEVILPDSDPRKIALEKDVEEIHRRINENREQSINGRQSSGWERYASFYDSTVLAVFKKNYKRIIGEVKALQDERAEAVVAVLKSPQLVDALTEYHGDDLIDGLAYAQVLGDGIEGLTSSEVGESSLIDWVNECSANEDNLLWSAMALNQTEAKASLNNVLAEYKIKAKSPFQVFGSLDLGKMDTLLEKFADTHTKALGLMSDDNLPRTGLGKIFSTMAHRFYQPLLKDAVDPSANRIMDIIFAAQHNTDLQQLIKDTNSYHLKKYLKAEKIKNKLSSTVTEEKIHQGTLGDEKGLNPYYGEGDRKSLYFESRKMQRRAQARLEKTTKHIDSLAEYHEQAKLWVPEVQAERSVDVKTTITAMKKGGQPNDEINNYNGQRFAIVVAIMQNWQFIQALKQVDKNSEEYHMLLAKAALAGLSLVGVSAEIYAGFSEMAAHPKYHKLANSRALNYKDLGAASGTIVAAAGAYFDFKDMLKYFDDEQADLGIVYGVKVLSDAILSMNSGASALGLLAIPLKKVSRATARSVGLSLLTGVASRAAVIVRVPVLGFYFKILMASLGVTVWVFTDKELQSWFEKCGFSTIKHKCFKAAYEQRKAFEKAVLII